MQPLTLGLGLGLSKAGGVVRADPFEKYGVTDAWLASDYDAGLDAIVNTGTIGGVNAVNGSAVGADTSDCTKTTGYGQHLMTADGVSDYMQMASNARWGCPAGESTTWIWRGVLPATVGNFGRLFASTDSSNDNGLILLTVGTDPVVYGGVDEGSNRNLAIPDSSYERPNQMQSVSLVVNATNVTIFIDGAQAKQVSRTAGSIPANIIRLFAAGGASASNYQTGSFAGAAIAYGRALTGSEIMAVANEMERRNRA